MTTIILIIALGMIIIIIGTVISVIRDEQTWFDYWERTRDLAEDNEEKRNEES